MFGLRGVSISQPDEKQTRILQRFLQPMFIAGPMESLGVVKRPLLAVGVQGVHS